MYTADDFLIEPKASDEYTLTLEYELQRSKEKNKILEERIKNKQIFIAEMKEMQIELDQLTQKCRVELYEERKKREHLEKVQVRNHLEKISELQHQISLLKNRTANEMEPYRKYFTNQKINHSTSVGKKQLSKNRSSKNLKKQEALSEVPVDNEENQMRKRFVNHFLEMVQVYIPSSKEQSEKKQLKNAWKWIKNVVKEWDDIGKEVKELGDFFQQVKQIVGFQNDEGPEEIYQVLKEWKNRNSLESNDEDLRQSNGEDSGQSNAQELGQSRIGTPS